MNFKQQISALITAATLVGTIGLATPAHAATSTYKLQCKYTYNHSARYYTYRCTWVPVTNTTPTTPVHTPAPAPKPTPAPTPATPTGMTAEEQQMLNLVNAERANAGLAPLKADAQMVKVARLKSQDMINGSYFSHQSPTYGSPFDMMKQFGITYRTAGENIAGNQSVQAAHTALMNSSGHRANILNPAFTTVGIGIVHGGPYGIMFTQQFKG